MKIIIRSVTIITIIVMLLSCSAKNNKLDIVAPENYSVIDAVVYVYRQHSMANIMVSPKILFDTGQSIDIKNNQYQYVVFKQDEKLVKRRIDIEVANRYGGVHTLNINTRQGEVVYLRLSTSLKFEKNQPYNRQFNLQKVGGQIAMSEIRKITYAGPTKNKEDTGRLTKQEVEAENQPESQADEQYTIMKARNPFNK